jgi:hypothetical protein
MVRKNPAGITSNPASFIDFPFCGFSTTGAQFIDEPILWTVVGQSGGAQCSDL